MEYQIEKLKFITIWNNNEHFTWMFIYFVIITSNLILKFEFFQKRFGEDKETYDMLNNVFPKIVRLMR